MIYKTGQNNHDVIGQKKKEQGSVIGFVYNYIINPKMVLKTEGVLVGVPFFPLLRMISPETLVHHLISGLTLVSS